MENIYRFITFLAFLCLVSNVTVAQSQNNGAVQQDPIFPVCDEPIEWDQQIRITYWIGRDQGDLPEIDENQCQEMTDALNAYFEDANVDFLHFTVQTMDNWQFFELEGSQEELQMTSMYHHVGVINIHLVDDISGLEDGDGYSFSPPNTRDAIIMKIEDFEPDNKRLPHLIGHFFGLYDTFATEGGVELADASNCDVAGDLVCDTYADVAGGSVVDEVDCNYDGAPLADSEGNLYYPPVDNIMSEYPDACRCRFTIGQLDRMYVYRLSVRTQLW